MNQILRNHYARATSMGSFLDDHIGFISSYPDIMSQLNKFMFLMDDFNKHFSSQQRPIPPVTAKKRRLQDAAAEITCKWGMRCYLKARETGNFELAELLNHKPLQIIKMEDNAGMAFMGRMCDALAENLLLFGEQGLSEEIISEISSALEAYDAVITAPITAIKECKLATRQMEVLMKKIDATLKDLLNLLTAQWSPDNWLLIMRMRIAFDIPVLGKRYTGITGTVKNEAGEALQNYKIVCPAADKKAISNIEGIYKIKTMKPGAYEFKLLNPEGFLLKTAVIMIRKGVTVKCDWRV